MRKLIAVLLFSWLATLGQQVAAANEWVSCVQEELTNLGYDPGPVDGFWGRNTESALNLAVASLGSNESFTAADAQYACDFLKTSAVVDTSAIGITDFSIDFSELALAEERGFDFSTVDVDPEANGSCNFSIYRHRLQDPADDEKMAEGALVVIDGLVDIVENEWFTGGLADASYLEDQADLAMDTQGNLHGSMPYFHMFINPNDLATPPEEVILGTRKDGWHNGSPSGKHWFNHNTWADGYIDLECTKSQSSDDLGSRSSIKDLQTKLNLLGFDAGVADGAWGRRSQAALDAFRVDQEMTNDGSKPNQADVELISKTIDEYVSSLMHKSARSNDLLELNNSVFNSFIDLPWVVDPYISGPKILVFTSLFKETGTDSYLTAYANLDERGWMIIIGDVWANINFAPGITPAYVPGPSDKNSHRYFVSEFETKTKQFEGFIKSLNIYELSRLNHICVKFSSVPDLEENIGPVQYWYSKQIQIYFERQDLYSSLAAIGQQCGSEINQHLYRLTRSRW